MPMALCVHTTVNTCEWGGDMTQMKPSVTCGCGLIIVLSGWAKHVSGFILVLLTLWEVNTDQFQPKAKARLRYWVIILLHHSGHRIATSRVSVSFKVPICPIPNALPLFNTSQGLYTTPTRPTLTLGLSFKMHTAAKSYASVFRLASVLWTGDVSGSFIACYGRDRWVFPQR